MEGLLTSLLFAIALFLLLSSSVAVDNIASNQGIKDGETIVSTGEMYELGFFSPGNSKNRYLGIWYKKISTGTVVWVANREFPLPDKTGTLKVSSEGLLLLSCCGDTVIWSSSSLAFVRYNNPVAQLLDTGNFVLKDGSSSNQRNFIWQSFDYPGDTLLPGMKLGKDFVTGTIRNLTSWKSPSDPSPGQYVDYMDTNGFPQLFLRQGLVIEARYGPWNGMRLSGVPSSTPNSVYSVEFVVNEKEVYYKFEQTSSVVLMISLKWDGTISIFHWMNRSGNWFSYVNGITDSCGRYGLCGPYGSCNINENPPCSCMEGFEPKSPDEWKIADWSGGCQLQRPLDRRDEDTFRKINKMKFPDTRNSWYNRSMTLGECEIACRRNYSCTAYANLDIRSGGSGCLLWFDELMDLKVCEESQDLYIKMHASQLIGHTDSQPGFNRNIKVLTIVMSILAVLIGVSVAVYAFSTKKRRSYMKGGGQRVHAIGKNYSEVEKEGLELNFISLSVIAQATNNFSIDNKLGEGGFGPVYKGVLEAGQEIAVKQLSRTSEQGYDEFFNEVVCVAKLQHRNLVKLLGYCMDGVERILIYEYMSNKSLDLFLFDENKSCMLEWPRRFCIINGIARGMLYLHQDSRQRIIHRDLKAANILLDHDMNPKISDFGLAREFVGNQITAKTKKVVGTYGYISPEYALHGRYSIKSDVFSFGVLVLEIVSGKKNREFSHEDLSDNLLGHAWRLYTEGKCLDLMSPSLRGTCIISEVKRSIHVGLLCVQNHAHDRPTMSSVVMMLGSDGSIPPPKQPAFFAEEGLPKLNTFSGVDEATITLLEPRY